MRGERFSLGVSFLIFCFFILMNVAIIAAAGQGTRAGGGQAKQFRELGGTPIIIHTLRRFEQSTSIREVIVVVPEGDIAGFLQLAGRYTLAKIARVVAGGRTRTETVWRGLQAVRAATAEIVAVHDGVRPFVTSEQIDLTVEAACIGGAAILAVPATDTIKEVRGARVMRTPERATLWHAQTPQCFRYELMRRAYERALAENWEVTDDSALVERLGGAVTVVEGDTRNIKITRPEDIAIAELLLREAKE
ncbi:MAG: 2-C-methyl-D-erythritol 4-phosphate cytidylyltransferase [Pyrinomonadaceae bacterium]|nr:2-C-methyl-D-erythritol 4-phosphate cytidylyltransferase [Pyrinomonadaceae bacterium]